MELADVCHQSPQLCLCQSAAKVKNTTTCAQPFPGTLWVLILLLVEGVGLRSAMMTAATNQRLLCQLLSASSFIH